MLHLYDIPGAGPGSSQTSLDPLVGNDALLGHVGRIVSTIWGAACLTGEDDESRGRVQREHGDVIVRRRWCGNALGVE